MDGSSRQRSLDRDDRGGRKPGGAVQGIQGVLIGSPKGERFQ